MDDVVDEDVTFCAEIVLALWTLVTPELAHAFCWLCAALSGSAFERRRARVTIWVRVYDISER